MQLIEVDQSSLLQRRIALSRNATTVPPHLGIADTVSQETLDRVIDNANLAQGLVARSRISRNKSRPGEAEERLVTELCLFNVEVLLADRVIDNANLARGLVARSRISRNKSRPGEAEERLVTELCLFNVEVLLADRVI
ncbi:hypothetical protein J6590_027143 [Homalodisca vitripennis]|nr:hypothetical protein J6590_027143 [Homalodisca vitripennis]